MLLLGFNAVGENKIILCSNSLPLISYIGLFSYNFNNDVKAYVFPEFFEPIISDEKNRGGNDYFVIEVLPVFSS